MVGTPLKNFRMFEQLCGKNTFRNVILTTTMWDEIDVETGEDREGELKSKSWRNMLEHGSKTGRFMRTRESAFDLIEPLLDASNRRTPVLLQHELVDMGKELHSTSAGQPLLSEMEVLVRQREDLLRRIRNEMKRTDGDNMTLDPSLEENQKLRTKLPLGHRLLNMTDKFFGTKLMVYNLRPSKPDHSPSNIDAKDSHTTSMIDSYESGSQIADPESEGYLLKADHQGRIDIKNLTHQLPAPESTSRIPLPNDSDVLTVNVQRPEPTGSELQGAHSRLSTTEKQAQDKAVSPNFQTKTTSAADPLLREPKPLPTSPLAVISEARFCLIDAKDSSPRPQQVRDLSN
jgi:hypothetical protein